MQGSAWAVGLATISGAGRVLDTRFPDPNLGSAPEGHGAGTVVLDGADAGRLAAAPLLRAARPDAVRGVRTELVMTVIEDLSAGPTDAHDAYLRLQLLSHRLVGPGSISMDGIFGVLSNVVWTSLGPCDPENFEDVRVRALAAGVHLTVSSVDKFPRMTDYVIPSGVRIADADRVRLGAHLAEGTTVMHEGFVNFNAGTLGASMVEGRISAGVIVGAGSDLGGSASVMGTLSGGGREVIRVGEQCLIGANAGIGISLGDGCVVEAGLYVTAGTRVTLPDGSIVKALELSGSPGMLFRRNSVTGIVEALPRTGVWGGLNSALHVND